MKLSIFSTEVFFAVIKILHPFSIVQIKKLHYTVIVNIHPENGSEATLSQMNDQNN